MNTLLGSVAAYTVILVLLVAAVGHLASPGALSRAVAAHGMLRWPVAIATTVTLVEAGLAVAGVLALSGAVGWLRFPVLAGSALLFAGYAGYSQQVRRTRPGAPCGCSRHDLPVTGWVVLRGYLLAGIACLGAVTSDPVLTLDQPGPPLAVALFAAGTFTALLWHLPVAMHTATPAAGRSHQTRIREGVA
jgi:hypothetical protein